MPALPPPPSQVLEVEPNHAKCINLRALIRRRLRDFDGAFEDLNSLMAINQMAAATSAAAAAAAAASPGRDGGLSTLLRSESMTRVDAGLPAGSGGDAPPPKHAPSASSSSASASLLAPLHASASRAISSNATTSALPPTHALTAVRLSQHETATQLREILGGATDMYAALFEQPTSVQQALAVRPKERSRADIEVICTLLRSLVFFRRLSPEVQRGFAEACQLRKFEEGDIVTEEGSLVRFLHIVLQGECSVKVAIGGGKAKGGTGGAAAAAVAGRPEAGLRDARKRGGGGGAANGEITVDRLCTGDHFGHLSILFGDNRTMNVVVRSTTADIIILPRVAFYRLGLDLAFIEDLEARRDLLRRTGAFTAFDEETILRLCCAANYRQCRKGTTIIRQGDVPRELCVLTRGIVHAFKAADALADLAEKMRGIAEEVAFLQDTFVYHASMRARPPGGLAAAATTADVAEVGPTSSADPRLGAVGRVLARGPSGAGIPGDLGEAYGAAARQMRSDAAAGAAPAATPMTARSATTARASAPAAAAAAVQGGGSTFVEDYVRELQAKLSALQREHTALSRQVAAGAAQGGHPPPPPAATPLPGGSAGSAVAPAAAARGAGGRPAAAVAAPRTHFRAMIESLFPPALLSPLAITEPYTGSEGGDYGEHGTVLRASPPGVHVRPSCLLPAASMPASLPATTAVAETYVEFLVIPKAQIDHRLLSKAQLEDVKARCTRFPPESRVAEQVAQEAAWQKYKRGVLAAISTRRWPAQPGQATGTRW